MRSMRYATTYDFDELDVGRGLLVNGQALLDWDYTEYDPTINQPGDFVYAIKKITVTTKNGNLIELKDTDDLYSDIYDLLMDDDYEDNIRQQLIDAMEYEHARDEDCRAFNDDLRND